MTAPTPRDTADHAELARLAEAIGPVEWFAGHLCRDDHPCDCAYVFDDGHAGAVATIHVSNGLPISEGGNDAPEPELAKLHQAFIAAANPATVLALLSEIAALRGERDEWKANYDRATRIHASTCRDLVQAERQRDEAVGLLELASASMQADCRGAHQIALNSIDTFLANQGADQ